MASKETLTLSPLEYYYLTCLLNAEDTNDFYEIEEMVWSGAIDTLNSIIEANKEDEFMDLLNM